MIDDRNILMGNRASTLIYHIARNLPQETLCLLPANVCYVVPMSLKRAGMRIEFVDIDPVTLSLPRDEVLQRVYRDRDPVTFLLHNRPYGARLSQDDDILREIALERPNLVVVDDRCMCRPDLDAVEAELVPGVDWTLYSTGYAKYCDLGFGGYAFNINRTSLGVTNTPALQRGEQLALFMKEIDRLLACGDAIADNSDLYSHDWLDQRLLELGEAEYFRQLTIRRDTMDQRKRAINEMYGSTLDSAYCLAGHYQNWRFNILSRNRDRLLQDLTDAGLFASGHYAVSAKLFGSENFPNASALSSSVVNLFNDFYIEFSQVEQVAHIVNKHLGVYGLESAVG